MVNSQHTHKSVFTCVISCLLFVIFLTASLRGQNVTGGLNYEEPCGCRGDVDLTIYNGLYGRFGGQKIRDNNEEELGAVTIANLNDTDGDGLTDSEDDEVTESNIGRNEVDLMRLDIEAPRRVAPACQFVAFRLSSSLRLWENSSKITPVENNRILVSDLPKTIYVEAIEVSENIRDLEIVAGLLDENNELVKTDVVLATAMWARIDENYTTRSVLPEPNNSLGIDEEEGSEFIKSINERFVSKDMTRYGQGTSVIKQYTLTDNSQIVEDEYYGGRILMGFEIQPSDIIPEIDNYGIKIDITRRKKIEIEQYNTLGEDLSRNVDWPEKLEEANDDFNTILMRDLYDEYTSPILGGGLVFSFDTPSEVQIGNPRTVISSKKTI